MSENPPHYPARCWPLAEAAGRFGSRPTVLCSVPLHHGSQSAPRPRPQRLLFRAVQDVSLRLEGMKLGLELLNHLLGLGGE